MRCVHAQSELHEAHSRTDKVRACARAAVARAMDYKTLATEYMTLAADHDHIAHIQAAESAAVWAKSIAAYASAPRFTVVRTPAARGPLSP